MQYDTEFKEKALKLSDEVGPKKAADQLGVKYQTLSDWRYSRNHKRIRISSSDETEAQARIKQLENEMAELKKENKVLKDTIGYFVRDRESEKNTNSTDVELL